MVLAQNPVLIDSLAYLLKMAALVSKASAAMLFYINFRKLQRQERLDSCFKKDCPALCRSLGLPPEQAK